MDELYKENKSAMKHAISIISYSEPYTKEEVKKAYTLLANDKRVEARKKNILLDKLRRIYKNK